jgi:hypothetical protein
MEAADDYTIFQTVEEQGHLPNQLHDQLALLDTTTNEVLLVLHRLNTTGEVLHTSDEGPPTTGRPKAYPAVRPGQ